MAEFKGTAKMRLKKLRIPLASVDDQSESRLKSLFQVKDIDCDLSLPGKGRPIQIDHIGNDIRKSRITKARKAIILNLNSRYVPDFAYPS